MNEISRAARLARCNRGVVGRLRRGGFGPGQLRAEAKVQLEAQLNAPVHARPPADNAAPASKPTKTAVRAARLRVPAAKPAALTPPARSGTEPDLAFGAFQRGYYLTAFRRRRDGSMRKAIRAP